MIGASIAASRQIVTPLLISKYDKLHLGCGPRQLAGWANIDISGPGNLIWDLRRPLPVKPQSIRFIYTEHFIEHITRPDALALLGSCKTVLKEGGSIRISTPDLRQLAKDYIAGKMPTLSPELWNPLTPCAMLNEGMRLWGHQFVYDEDELVSLLNQVGFSRIRRMRWNESDLPDFRNLESRSNNNDLILEAA
jgi:predicted SAM-dependent methyltransferase